MYNYYESCVCGSNVSLQAPTSMSYEWDKMVASWRENHKHEVRNLYPPALYGTIGASTGFDPAKFHPENMEDFDLPDPVE